MLVRGLQWMIGVIVAVAALHAVAERATGTGTGLVATARAQYAPEGNSPPPSEAVAAGAEELPNPFGEPEHLSRDRVLSVAKKHAFASQVDLRPLRELAVWHNGRVKVMDTLARETVLQITGRRAYFDLEPPAGSPAASATGLDAIPSDSARKLPYDPMFTLIDMIVDPGYYFDKAVLGVNYLPLREVFLERTFPGDRARVERWMRLQRIAPSMVNAHGPKIAEEFFSERPYREALASLDSHLEIWRLSRANMMLVAPDSRERSWKHLSMLPADHPVRKAALELGAAWRAADAAGVNRAVATLAAELPRINPEQYPTTRRSLELMYNRSNAFELGMWAYFLTFLTLVLGLGTGRRWLLSSGLALLLVAVGLHAFGFITRCLIAERFAIQNQFESMTGVSLFAAIVGLGMMLLKRQHLFAAAAAGVGFLVLVTATQTAIPGQVIEREAAILNTSVLLKYHVTTVLVSYGLIALGFIISLFFLATHYAAVVRQRQTSATVALAANAVGTVTVASGSGTEGAAAPSTGVQRTLDELDTAQVTVLQLAFWTLGVGILLGAWWADHSWGRWWAFDPKETWALITWIVYLIVIHLRFTTGRNKALITAWLSVVGFVVMLWTYFGVNLLLPGLHAYA